MGIVADGTIASANRAVDVAHTQPFLFINMAVKTEPLNLAGGHHHSIGITVGLMTGSAEQGRGREMSPLGARNDVTVAGITLRRKLAVANLVNDRARRQLLGMTSRALPRNRGLLMEAVNPGGLQINVQQ